MADFKMPQLGETVVEGTITRWLKSEGDSVQVDEPLVEVSTDKVDSEIPSPTSGVLTKINAQEGETVSVGDVIAVIGDDGDSSSSASEVKAAEEPAEAVSEDSSQEEAAAPSTEQASPTPAEETAPAPARAEPAAVSASLEATAEEPRRGILSPLVRKMAADHGVDLGQVKGTGTGGRITKNDIHAHVDSAPADAGAQPATSAEPEQAAAPRTAPKVGKGGEEIVPLGHMRKAIAEHMVTSLHETARAWNTIEVDLTNIARLREKFGPAFKEKEGFSLTWMPFLTKAVTQVLLRNPNINGTWNGDGTISRKHFVNLGIAVALENGLIVPVVKGADGMNLVGLARGVRDLATRARSRKLVPDDVAGGTFTITNPGPFGSILSVPIINKGQAAILAFDAVVKRPVVLTDEDGADSIAIRHMVFLSLSWDHRIVDGAEAAVFLKELKEVLETEDHSGELSAYVG
jgi:2-oxoglutarate dehydrogenase E2 component (dihydrolipoamide succinyltransferase)